MRAEPPESELESQLNIEKDGRNRGVTIDVAALEDALDQYGIQPLPSWDPRGRVAASDAARTMLHAAPSNGASHGGAGGTMQHDEAEAREAKHGEVKASLGEFVREMRTLLLFCRPPEKP